MLKNKAKLQATCYEMEEKEVLGKHSCTAAPWPCVTPQAGLMA